MEVDALKRELKSHDKVKTFKEEAVQGG